MKKAGLALGALPQGVSPEIDFISLIIQPVNLLAMLFELESVEAAGRGAKKRKHLTFRQQRPQVYNTGESVLPDDLDYPVDDRLGTLHRDDVSHLSSPASATLRLRTRRSLIPSGVRKPMIAHG